MAVGQISGPLLSPNLVRNGINLSIDTDLVFYDVINRRVGIHRNTPNYDLDVNNLIHTTNLVVDNNWQVGHVLAHSNGTIEAVVGNLNIGVNDTVKTNRIIGGAVQIKTNIVGITSAYSTANLYVNPSSLQTNLHSNSLVNGSLHATGDITADGNIQLGTNQPNDTITFGAEIISDLVPKTDITYNIGTSSLRWNNFWNYNLTSTALYSTNVSSSLQSNYGDFIISSNTITTAPNEDIHIVPRSGQLYAEHTLFYSNTITQNTTNEPIQFSSAGTGYWQITTPASGIQVPSGTSAQQPSTAHLSQIRFNTQLGYLEVYNGTAWQPAIGNTGAASLVQVEDESVIWQLVLD
jgi:hypothetical protein